MTQMIVDTTLTDSAARLRMAIVRMARRLRQEAAGAAGELTPTSAAALATVERHGPLTPSELAEIERVKRPTATRTLRVLGEAGGGGPAPDPQGGRTPLGSNKPTGRGRRRRGRGRKNRYMSRQMCDQ